MSIAGRPPRSATPLRGEADYRISWRFPARGRQRSSICRSNISFAKAAATSSGALPNLAALLQHSGLNDARPDNSSSFTLDVRRLDDRPPPLDFALLLGGQRLRRLLCA